MNKNQVVIEEHGVSKTQSTNWFGNKQNKTQKQKTSWGSKQQCQHNKTTPKFAILEVAIITSKAMINGGYKDTIIALA